MMSITKKRVHKGISLLIKTVILIISFLYIWQKIVVANNTIDFKFIFQSPNNYLFITFLLMFLNWGLEAIKWKILVSQFEKITFLKSLQSIFSGVTVSIFTPNRVGEFAGRIFFLEKSNKLQAIIASIIGSAFQMFITISAGIVAYYILEIGYDDYFGAKQFISTQTSCIMLFSIVLLILAFIFVYTKRNSYFLKSKKYIEVLTNYSASQLAAIFFLSLMRYAVFSFQYYLVLRLFGINAGITLLFSLIALTFFVTSAIPTFALTEIAVRGATAVYFIGTIYTQSTSIIGASLLLWIINLAIPALIGGAFIWKLKFFKDETNGIDN